MANSLIPTRTDTATDGFVTTAKVAVEIASDMTEEE